MTHKDEIEAIELLSQVRRMLRIANDSLYMLREILGDEKSEKVYNMQLVVDELADAQEYKNELKKYIHEVELHLDSVNRVLLKEKRTHKEI